MNTRFAVAVHILTLIDSQRGEPASSEWIASSVGTHPALVRRLLSLLSASGLARSQLGAGGGALLARPADEITLADVFRAVADDTDVIPIHTTPSPRCPIGRNIQTVLQARFTAAERALLAELDRTTIASLGRSLARRGASQ